MTVTTGLDTLLRVANEVRCFHSHPPSDEDQLAEGTEVRGVVVCVHPFGIGVYLPEKRVFGHVDAIFLGRPNPGGLPDYPGVGSDVELTAVGYSGGGQLRLRVIG